MLQPMIGVVVRAHNEEVYIVACLEHIRKAIGNQRLKDEPVDVVVVADACSDDTASLAEEAGAKVIVTDSRNVGAARRAGADCLLHRQARWLAFTDADTLVSPDWLAEQLELDADVVCGTVAVEDWTPHAQHADFLKGHFSRTYFDVDAHRHVHGANLGVSAEAYRQSGGFRALACNEDVELVRSLEACGMRIAWGARPRVTTSARRIARTSGGFADTLIRVVAQHLVDGAPGPASLERAS